LDVGKRALALKSRLKRQHLAVDGLKLMSGLALTIYRFFYEFTDFSKKTEMKEPEHKFSGTTTLAKRGGSK
jgi:hypothetical protein